MYIMSFILFNENLKGSRHESRIEKHLRSKEFLALHWMKSDSRIK